MSRYFLEIQYKGTNYSGLASQKNNPKVNTVQGLIDDALSVLLKEKIVSTTSSRTDAGVHAFQNYLHFNSDNIITDKFLYNINSILPQDIIVKNIINVADDAHSRFDPIAREYIYYISQSKNAFVIDTAYYFPYQLNIDLLNTAASILLQTTNFQSFCKKHTDVFTYDCTITKSIWSVQENNILTYNVIGNRFLRGMVRGLVGTMLKVGAGYINISEFIKIIESKDCTKANFNTPAHGLFLKKVVFDTNYFNIENVN